MIRRRICWTLAAGAAGSMLLALAAWAVFHSSYHQHFFIKGPQEFYSRGQMFKHTARLVYGLLTKHPPVPATQPRRTPPPSSGWISPSTITIDNWSDASDHWRWQVSLWQQSSQPDSRYHFDYQSATDPAINTLISQYDLRALVETADSEWDALVALRRWVHARWDDSPRSFAQVPEPLSALDILDNASKGERPICSLAAKTYIQVASALGFPARFVQAHQHVTSEVWSNDYRKWVIMDAHFNCHFERDASPLSIAEVRQAFRNGSGDTIICRTEDQPPTLEKYQNFAIVMRNDLLSQHYPRWHPMYLDYLKSWVQYTDQDTSPSLVFQNTSRLEDLYWPLNETEIWLQPLPSDGNTLNIAVWVSSYMPNFKSFIITHNGQEHEVDSHMLSLHLTPGLHTITAWSRNLDRRNGPPAVIKITVEQKNNMAIEGS